jgi:carboxyl-terminal processing protease
VFDEKEMISLARVPDAVLKVKNREQARIRKILSKPEGFENYVNGVLLNAIAQNFDPHTSFFTNTDKENFESFLSKESYSFGFGIDMAKSGEFIIDRIMPGSPAWKSNKLQKGDYLLEAASKGRPNLVFAYSDTYDVYDYLQSSDVVSIELKVKHSDGIIETVPLSKAKLKVEQNQIISYILNGNRKIGYIALPDFYVGDDQRGLGCSNDVAKEILKLSKEKIDGLVIDVRNNGGGDFSRGK